MTVAIVGAGVTGLSAAYLLLQRGIPVRVYEAAATSGGLAATFRRDGFAFDFGPHEFVSDNPALRTLLEEVCGDELLSVRKRVAQYFRGRTLSYPFEISDVLRALGPAVCAKVIAEVLFGPLFARDREAAPTFASWTRSRFGPTLYRLYFEPYTRKVWGVEPDELDVQTAKSRISVDSAWELLRKTIAHQFFGREEFDKPHSELRNSFLYVRHGIGRLQDRLEQRVRDLGGEVHFGKRLAALELDQRRVRALRFDDGGADADFDYVLSSAPLPLLSRLAFGDDESQRLQGAGLRFRGMIFVFLRLRQERVSDYHWTYFPEPGTAFQRTTEFVHFGAEMTPPGCTGLAIEIASNPRDGVWEQDDRALVESCLGAFERLGQIQRSNVLGWDVFRVPHAYPIQVRGYRAAADGLLECLARFENLVSIGRQGLFRYCNINECLEMSLDVSAAIAAGRRSIRYTGASSWVGVFAESAGA